MLEGLNVHVVGHGEPALAPGGPGRTRLGLQGAAGGLLAIERDVAGAVLFEGFYEGDRGTLVQRTKDAIDRGGFAAYAEQRCDAMFVESSDPALRERSLERSQAEPRVRRHRVRSCAAVSSLEACPTPALNSV